MRNPFKKLPPSENKKNQQIIDNITKWIEREKEKALKLSTENPQNKQLSNFKIDFLRELHEIIKS